MTDYSFKTYEKRNGTNYGSSYKDNFLEHNMTKQQEQAEMFEENKQNLRKNNYKLGNQENDFHSVYNL